MRRRLLVAVAALAILATLWVMYDMAFVASRGDSSPLYSLYRYDPYGTAALAELLRERGHAVSVLRRPRLEKEQRGVLIQVLPLHKQERGESASSNRRLQTVQTAALCDWIAEGNTVVQFAREETPLLRRLLGRKPNPIEEMAAPEVPRRAVRKGYATPPAEDTVESRIEKHEARGRDPKELPGMAVNPEWTPQGRALGVAPPLSLRSPHVLEIPEHSRLTPLAGDTGVVAAEVRFGEGRLIYVGAPTPALNSGITEGGNLDFILAVVGDRPVIGGAQTLDLPRERGSGPPVGAPIWFDEWSHGVGQERGILSLITEMGYRPVLIQIGFVLALFVWSTLGHRPRDLDQPPAPRPGSEQIETLGYLHSLIYTREQTRARVAQVLRRRLSAALGCPQEHIEMRVAAGAQIASSLRERSSAPLVGAPIQREMPPQEAERLRALLALSATARTGREFCRLLTESSDYLKAPFSRAKKPRG